MSQIHDPDPKPNSPEEADEELSSTGGQGTFEDNSKPKRFSLSWRLGEGQKETLSEAKILASELASSVGQLSEEDRLPDLLYRYRYRHARSVLEDFFSAAKEGQQSDTLEVYVLACSLVDNILATHAVIPSGFNELYDQSFFMRAFCKDTESSDLTEHGLKVAILAAKLGSLLDYCYSELVRLTVAALLHNVGMLFVSPKILNKRGPLTDDEIGAMRKHSELGAEFVREMGPEYHDVADIIYEVHERENGQGYPRNLKGEEIHNDAKVIGICDVYVAMTQDRHHRESFIPFNALQKILLPVKKDQFCPSIVNALVEALSMFPVGSLVQFSSGEVGRVVKANAQRPMRPVVELLLDDKGQRIYPLRIIDLAEHPLLTIKAVITKEMIAGVFE